MICSKLLNECNGKIKVLALTAIRSEYDLLYPLMKALDKDPVFNVGFIVAGAHLTALHNYSVNLIRADGFNVVAEIDNFKISPETNTTAGRVKSAAYLLDRLTDVLTTEHPDLFVYLGDREEPLMGAIACNYLGIPSLHIAGGDNAHPVGGDVDEEARHATTKLSHLHMTMAEEHSVRILNMGEEAWRVKTVGNPGLDRLRLEPVVDINSMESLLGSSVRKDYLVLIYHAVSSGLDNAAEEFEIIINECIDTGLELFVGAPNSDPGYADLLAVINKFAQHPQIHLYNNIPRAEFVTLLKKAKAIVGNSSLGLLEASFIGIPAINVGQRQRGRLAGVNVQFVDAKSLSIKNALQKALFDKNYLASLESALSPYGDGYMVERTVPFIKDLPTKEKLLDKRITY